MAMILEKTAKKLSKNMNLFKMVMLICPIVILVAIKNLSTAIILFGIGVCMIFVASKKYYPFLVVGGLAGALVAVFSMSNYRSDRINAWLHPETAGDSGYQTLQGLYAIGSGGFFGKGLGQSLQKMGNVPEAQNDMIFTIICEELGLFGGICVILLFMLLIWRMMIIANNAQDLFGALLVVGVMSHVAIQVILNIAVVTISIPNTGVILPFISYGGTSFAFLMAEMGLVLSVSRGIRLDTIK
jgi:cell division protein FtsW